MDTFLDQVHSCITLHFPTKKSTKYFYCNSIQLSTNVKQTSGNDIKVASPDRKIFLQIACYGKYAKHHRRHRKKLNSFRDLHCLY